MDKIRRLVIILVVAMLTGCAAYGVFSTSDPKEKLRTAVYLYEKQNRPLPAERLIQEALDIYMSKNDDLGIAESYRQYSFFLKSPTIGRWEPHYRGSGFMDKAVSFDSRFEKSLEYLQKARDIYTKHAQYDALSNVDLVMGRIYLLYLGDEKKACQYFDRSLTDQLKFKKDNPNVKIALPDGFESFADYIAAVKKDAKCF